MVGQIRSILPLGWRRAVSLALFLLALLLVQALAWPGGTGSALAQTPSGGRLSPQTETPGGPAPTGGTGHAPVAPAPLGTHAVGLSPTTVGFVDAPYSGTVGSPVTMTATAPGASSLAQYTWSFGDGTVPSTVVGNPTTQHTYTTAGTFTVSLSFYDPSTGASGANSTTAVISGNTTTLTVTTNGPYTGTVGSPVSMVAFVSGAPVVNPQFTWWFGDGTSATGQVVSHVYNTPDTYSVLVSVYDPGTGRSGANSTTATISAVTPTLTVSAGGPYTGTVGTAVGMGALASHYSGTPEYAWSFGDGTYASGQFVFHTYSTAGTFPVTVTVYDSGPTGTGLTATASTTATISGGTTTCGTGYYWNGTACVPISGGGLQVSAGGPYTGTVGNTVLMFGTATGYTGTPTFTWSFGDGTTGSGATVAHNYNSAGTFNVSLTVTDSGTGLSNSASTTATISGGTTGNCSYLGAGYYWNGYTCVYGYGTTGNCSYLGANYYWNGSSCVYDYSYNYAYSGNCAYLGAGYYWNGYTCVYGYNSAGNCAYLGANYYWNGSSCVYNYTYNSYSGTGNCAYLGAGYYWNGYTCVYGYGGAGNCSYLGSNYYWNGSTCVYNYTYNYNGAGNCTYPDVWNGYTCVYNGYNGAGNCSYPLVWNGYTCVYNGYNGVSNCSYPLVWNGYTCVLNGTGTYTTTCPNGQVINPSIGQTCPYFGGATGTCVQYSSTTGACVSYASTASTAATGNCVQYSSTTGACVSYASTTATPYAATGSCIGITLLADQSCTNGIVTCAGSNQAVSPGTPCSAAVAGTCVQYSPTTGACESYASTAATGACTLYSSTTGACVSYASTAPTANATTAAGSGATVTYTSGWNLIAGAPGVTLSNVESGPFAYTPSSNSYQAVPAGQSLQDGQGYWVQFSAATTLTLPAGNPPPASEPLPAGQYVLIGNSSSTAVTVNGADVVYVYSPVLGTYQLTTTLMPGEGAWAYSANGATASFTSATTTAGSTSS